MVVKREMQGDEQECLDHQRIQCGCLNIKFKNT